MSDCICDYCRLVRNSGSEFCVDLRNFMAACRLVNYRLDSLEGENYFYDHNKWNLDRWENFFIDDTTPHTFLHLREELDRIEKRYQSYRDKILGVDKSE